MAVSDSFVIEKRRRVSVLDIPLALLAPRRLFARVENVTGYGGAFLVLLTALTFVGYATIETGLIDRSVAEASTKRQAELERQFADVVQRSNLIKALEEERKQCEFERLMKRLAVIVAAPLKELAAVLLIAAALYGAVALGGRKPEWHALLTICVFAGFVDVVASVVRLSLMLRHSTLQVDTSAALLARLAPAAAQVSSAPPVAEILLSAVEPFRIWFWLVVLAGVTVTAQLSKWRARVTCFLLWFTVSAVQVAMAFAAAASRAAPAPA